MPMKTKDYYNKNETPPPLQTKHHPCQNEICANVLKYTIPNKRTLPSSKNMLPFKDNCFAFQWEEGLTTPPSALLFLRAMVSYF